MPQSRSSKAGELRDKARSFARLADYARSSADRKVLLRMGDACADLAANQDWLGGLPPVPPANSNALLWRSCGDA
jgi:hypothetical protein